MDTRVAVSIAGIFFFGAGIGLLVLWSGSIRIFIAAEAGTGHSFAGEIVALATPPLVSIAFGALLFYLNDHPQDRRTWKRIAAAMLAAGGGCVAMQIAYPIYFASISGLALQVFPGMALTVMALLIAGLQPFARPDADRRA